MAAPGSSRRALRVLRRAIAPVVGLALLAVPAAEGGASVTVAAQPAPTEAPTTTAAPAPRGPEVVTGLIAYITRDGRVWVGTGSGIPTPIGDNAAVDERGIGEVRISPSGRLVAWIRQDGSIAVDEVDGGAQRVLATDAAVGLAGGGRLLAWTPESDRLVYVAAGEADRAILRAARIDGGGTDTLHNEPGRSITGVTWSMVEDFGVVSSVVPGTDRRYTLMIASSSVPEGTVTGVVADDPAFAADGSFIVATTPAPGGWDLARVSTYTFQTTSLATSTEVCLPAVSPDGSMLAYAAGPDCSRLFVVEATGGTPRDITPAGVNDGRFGVGALEWTADGGHITHADCRVRASLVECNGPVWFIRADGSGASRGPTAGTIVPHRRLRPVDPVVVFDINGAIADRLELPVVAARSADLLTFDDNRGGKVDAAFDDGTRRLRLRLVSEGDSGYVSGVITFNDPATGEDRSVNVIGNSLALGSRVLAVRGVWFSTAELPFRSGEFTLSVRRDR